VYELPNPKDSLHYSAEWTLLSKALQSYWEHISSSNDLCVNAPSGTSLSLARIWKYSCPIDYQTPGFSVCFANVSFTKVDVCAASANVHNIVDIITTEVTGATETEMTIFGIVLLLLLLLSFIHASVSPIGRVAAGPTGRVNRRSGNRLSTYILICYPACCMSRATVFVLLFPWPRRSMGLLDTVSFPSLLLQAFNLDCAILPVVSSPLL